MCKYIYIYISTYLSPAHTHLWAYERPASVMFSPRAQGFISPWAAAEKPEYQWPSPDRGE